MSKHFSNRSRHQFNKPLINPCCLNKPDLFDKQTCESFNHLELFVAIKVYLSPFYLFLLRFVSSPVRHACDVRPLRRWRNCPWDCAQAFRLTTTTTTAEVAAAAAAGSNSSGCRGHVNSSGAGNRNCLKFQTKFICVILHWILLVRVATSSVKSVKVAKSIQNIDNETATHSNHLTPYKPP